jgi:hypothetical protein
MHLPGCQTVEHQTQVPFRPYRAHHASRSHAVGVKLCTQGEAQLSHPWRAGRTHADGGRDRRGGRQGRVTRPVNALTAGGGKAARRLLTVGLEKR